MSALEQLWGKTAYNKAAREVYVDGQGMASDDDGNRWQVDSRSWPEGTYFGSDARRIVMEEAPQRARSVRPPQRAPSGRPPPLARADQLEWKQRAIKLGLALLYRYEGKGKSASFVYDVYSKRIERGFPLSDKQQSWFESLEKGNSVFTTKIPVFKPDSDDVRFFGANHILVKKTGPLAKWAGKLYETTTPAGEKHYLMLKGKATGSGPPPSSARDGQMEALQDFLMARPDNDFMLSILRQLQGGKGLSTAQLKAVRRNFYQARMRDKADLFR